MFAAESLSSTTPESRMVQIDNPLNRLRVEQFIQRCFQHEHGATVDSFAAQLIALLDRDQRLQAAVGYQSAADGPLFLEQYLNQPIEQHLSRQTDRRISRDKVLEVGNLASHSSGWTRQLILSLAPFFLPARLRMASDHRDPARAQQFSQTRHRSATDPPGGGRPSTFGVR